MLGRNTEFRRKKTLLKASALHTLLASLQGYPPALAVEFGRKVLYSTERPSFQELEDHVKQAKAAH